MTTVEYVIILCLLISLGFLLIPNREMSFEAAYQKVLRSGLKVARVGWQDSCYLEAGLDGKIYLVFAGYTEVKVLYQGSDDDIAAMDWYVYER